MGKILWEIGGFNYIIGEIIIGFAKRITRRRRRGREPCRKPKKVGCVNRIVNQIVNLRIENFGKIVKVFLIFT